MLPGLVAVDTPLASPCGAGSTLSGSALLTLTGGSLGVGATCSFDVTLAVPADAADAAGGVYPNVTSALQEGGVEVAPPATADLVVQPLPTIAKVFVPDEVEFGGTSTVSIILDNSDSTLPATGVSFTDTLPEGSPSPRRATPPPTAPAARSSSLPAPRRSATPGAPCWPIRCAP